MPYSEPQNVTLYITADDIANSSQGKYNNCVAVCIKRMRDNLELPGLTTQQDVSDNCQTVFADTNVYYENDTLISECGVWICTKQYGTDHDTAIKVALQNIAGIKPLSPFTATLSY